jgi:hypothetical protein
MAWVDLVDSLDQTVTETFGVAAVLNPAAGAGPISFTGVESAPADMDVKAATRLFVKGGSVTPMPLRGDQISIGAVNYDVLEVDPDIVGGIMLRLHERA